MSRWEAVELGHGGLALVPRLRVLLSFTRADLSVKALDEWQLRQSLLAFLRDALSISISDKDLSLHKHRDPHKKRSNDAVASGVLYIWDIQALRGENWSHREDADTMLQRKEALIVDKLTGIELNLGGLKLRCHACSEERDDFSSMKRLWHEAHETLQTGFPDTMVLRGIPSRWLAELRVSSKASVLVTHTIFSHFGMIRNLDIQEDDSETLSCNVWVQFEHYSNFYNAMRAFCSHSMIREGSSFKANYEVSWDNDGYFNEGNIRKRRFEKERVDELRRRQLIMEERQAGIARRQAELARLEQERMETERMERLREEEKRRKEREDALAEQEMLKQKELERMREEEKIQREEEQKAIEMIKRESELRKEEEKKKENQRVLEMESKETWTNKLRRIEVQGTKDRSQVEVRHKLEHGGLRTDDEKLPWKSLPRKGLGELGNQPRSPKQREHSNRPQQSQILTRRQDDKVEGINNDEFERWALFRDPSTFSENGGTIIEDNKPTHYKKRVRSVIVDLRNT